MAMKAWILSDGAEKPLVLVRDLPVPQPRPGEVLVRVQAAGVTPTELAWHPTTHKKDGSPRQHAVPIHEFAGTVVEVGEGVTTIAGGEEAFGMNDWYEQGALAE